jgi:arylsulfatase A-like enzyme
LISSRFFLSSLLAALCAQILMGQRIEANEAEAPLNVLVIISDDQRWDELGVVQREQGDNARFPFIQTPRLDEFAAQGMRFRNSFVTTSICSPGRAAILTGQYAHTNGIIDNKTFFSPRPTWATALQAEGYTTAMIGKWHHGNQRDRPGFDFVRSFVNQGEYNDMDFIVEGAAQKTVGYIDAVTADFAIEFMKEQGNKPFAMLVGFKAVHEPFIPMQKHANNYTNNVAWPSPNMTFIAPWVDTMEIFPIPFDRGADARWRKIMRTLDGLDENVGRILAALDSLNLADNTLVIFASDNGYYLGEHELGDKRSAYEESIRVPMLVRLPGVIEAGKVSDEMVLNIDVAPTILDLVTGKVPAAMQGRSMRPLFDHDPDPDPDPVPWREAFLYEYWQGPEGGKGAARTPTMLGVRTKTHKLITYPGNPTWTEVFDLAADPYEIRNLARFTPESETQKNLCLVLQQLLDETDFQQAEEILRVHRPPLTQVEC